MSTRSLSNPLSSRLRTRTTTSPYRGSERERKTEREREREEDREREREEDRERGTKRNRDESIERVRRTLGENIMEEEERESGSDRQTDIVVVMNGHSKRP